MHLVPDPLFTEEENETPGPMASPQSHLETQSLCSKSPFAFASDEDNPATLNNGSRCYRLTRGKTIHFELSLLLYEVVLKVTPKVRFL